MSIMLKTLFLLALTLPSAAAAEKGWVSLFNGKDFTSWKVNENTGTFTIREGAIVAHGPRSHCFYVGDFMNHTFRNFELKVDIKTENNSNGGVYILTGFQESGWPAKGFEVQVNNTFVKDPRKTASLYAVKDNLDKVADDDKWFTEHIIVKDNKVTIKVDDKVVTEWTQPADWAGTKDFPERRINPGTIALQGHDPGSTVYYRNIRIKPM
jgi:hypothetical protein